KEPVIKLSGGQRQSVAIARAIHFNAQILIMDEPTAALGPQETAQVGELIKQLKADGIGIFLISHDIHDVFDLADRVCVMKNGQVVGTARTQDVTKDEVLGMIILGKCPPGAVPGPGAMQAAGSENAREVVASAEDRPAEDHKQHQIVKYDEDQDAGEAARQACYSGEAEQACNAGDDEKDDDAAEHEAPPSSP